MKEQILQYLSNQKFCTISTVSVDGKPESAFVGFTVNEKLEFMIGTSNQSRKFKNISANPAVAIVVADLSGEVQYEGRAYVADENDEGLVNHFAKLPGSKKYRQDPTQSWIKVEPVWVRFIQHGEIDSINEITEFE